MTDMDDDERARQLFVEGAGMLGPLWDDAVAMTRGAEHPSHHAARGTLAYAGVLLREGTAESAQRAERAIRAVLAMQETRPGDAHCGNFRWTLEEEAVSDLNGVEFTLEELISLLRSHGQQLQPTIVAEMRDAIALGLEEIDRLDVDLSYTNIALSDICNSVLGGELLGDDLIDDGESFGARFVARGARRLDEWFAFTSRSGAPHEFNSPTYLAVDIERMAGLAAHTSDAEIALKARIAEELLWLHVATHYHAGLGQIAGPHSRSYFDGWTGAGGYLKLLLWRVLGDDVLRRKTPYARRTREEAQTAIAGDELHCPGYVVDWLREKGMPFASSATTDAVRGLDLTTYMTEQYALGTASRAHTVGAAPEQWPAFNSTLLFFRRDTAPSYGSLFARYISDDRDRTGGERTEDLWDEGTFVGAQHRNRAIVAYGLTARMRAARSYKLSVRMLGAGADTVVYAGDRRVDATPIAIEPGEPIVIGEGGVYIAIIPLEPTDMGSAAPIELRIEGHALVLDIYNYLGPPKQFWEYRSLAGPFSKGNVRNAFVLEVAERAEFADVDAFRRHIAAAHIADTTGDAYVREIAYASDGGSIALRYSLLDMTPLARMHDGVVYAAPMARAGALDGAGTQCVVSRDSIVMLGRGTKLIAGQSTKWLVSDDDSKRYVFVHPDDDTAPVWLETPYCVVECDAFGFGRIEIDGAAGTISIEANGAIGAVRIGGAAGARLVVSAVDVTDAMTAVDGGAREFRGVD